jgi:hypothetical protein
LPIAVPVGVVFSANGGQYPCASNAADSLVNQVPGSTWNVE